MQDNSALVQQMYAAYAKGDVAAILSHVTDDIVWASEAAEPIRWGGIRHGIEETKGFFQGLAEQLTDPVLEITETVASGDAVATFGRFKATIRHTGRRLDTPVAHFFRFRGGKVSEFRNYTNTAVLVTALNERASTSGSSASSGAR